MPKKKFVVTGVKLRIEASVSNYLKTSSHSKDMAELLKGVKDMKNWVVEPKGDSDVAAAYPKVDGHPGHVHGKDWKLNVERGTKTVDRLILSKRKYTVTPNKKDPNQLNVEIYAAAFCETDTH